MTSQSIIGYEIQNQTDISQEAASFPIVSRYQLPENQKCITITIRLDLNIVVAGCYEMLLIFELNNGRLRMIQNISFPKFYAKAQFMHKSNKFICFVEENISIWGEENENWQMQEIVENSQSSCVWEVLITTNEDQIIVSTRKSINFLKKQPNWKNFQTLIFRECDACYSMCLNKENTQLMLGMFLDYYLEIRYKNKEEIWLKYQTIQTEYNPTARSCFIGCDILCIQPFTGQNLYVYETNKFNMLFQKRSNVRITQDHDLSLRFPAFFDYKKQQLICQHGRYINIFCKKNNQFILEHSIAYQDSHIYGSVSEDGQYMIIFENQSSQFQIRQQ